ncbi:hypothetical protein [Methylomonas koyamae]|uniref:hypothetical protein n=1 Tax=Methylomonas koyamae TaxID=702114 RepID=UPI0028733FCE|nr:hypothetical protein [Methylomonas koyamae]WNB73894.1 hypothetical protein RI210_11400 [Methylomonas koyamae]
MATENPTEPKLKDQTELSSDDFNIHRQLVFWLFIATALMVILTTTALIDADQGNANFKNISILPMVAVAGTLGAFVSALRRLYSFQNIFPSARYRELIKGADLYVIAYSSIPPLIGLIASVLLYIIFASELLKGAVFPAFICEEGKCDQFVDFLKHWKPTAATDYAKAIVWGFIAGFSERFVPDILNRLAENNGGSSSV